MVIRFRALLSYVLSIPFSADIYSPFLLCDVFLPSGVFESRVHIRISICVDLSSHLDVISIL